MTAHPANLLHHALNKVRAAALALPLGGRRDRALAAWAKADNAENRRTVRLVFENAKALSLSAGENDYDGDGGREYADHLRDNGERS